MSKPAAAFEPLALAVLTVSDTRTPDNDTSGDLLVQRLEEAGHHLQARQIVKDDIYQLRKVVSEWIADERIQGIVTTGQSHGDLLPARFQ
jgi:molybdenum cofactor biosynthesis protein B